MDNLLLIVHIVSICLSYAIFFFASLAALLYLIEDVSLKHKHLGPIMSRLPSLSTLDKLNYQCIGFGFPLLSLAIAIAVFQVKDVSIRHIYTVVLWILYALILHVRLSAKLRGRKVALLSLAAFCIILLTLFGHCGN